MRNPPGPWVYFIRPLGHDTIKIGTSIDPVGRIRSLQTGSPYRLQIERYVYGWRITEQLFHDVFASNRIPWTKEWFYEPELLLTVIDETVARQIAQDPQNAEEMHQAAAQTCNDLGLVVVYQERPRYLRRFGTLPD